jgi:hypothetical protein
MNTIKNKKFVSLVLITLLSMTPSVYPATFAGWFGRAAEATKNACVSHPEKVLFFGGVIAAIIMLAKANRPIKEATEKAAKEAETELLKQAFGEVDNLHHDNGLPCANRACTHSECLKSRLNVVSWDDCDRRKSIDLNSYQPANERDDLGPILVLQYGPGAGAQNHSGQETSPDAASAGSGAAFGSGSPGGPAVTTVEERGDGSPSPAGVGDQQQPAVDDHAVAQSHNKQQTVGQTQAQEPRKSVINELLKFLERIDNG